MEEINWGRRKRTIDIFGERYYDLHTRADMVIYLTLGSKLCTT